MHFVIYFCVVVVILRFDLICGFLQRHLDLRTRTTLSLSSSTSNTISEICAKKIEELIPATSLRVLSSSSDPNGAHITIECISQEFEGKSTLQRQRLIYKAIWDEMSSGKVHAVDSIVAKTPEEAGIAQ